MGNKMGLSVSCFTNGVNIQDGCWAKMVDIPRNIWKNAERRGSLKYISDDVLGLLLIMK